MSCDILVLSNTRIDSLQNLHFIHVRMLQRGQEYKDSLPDDESYDLIISVLLSTSQIDSALKYIDLALGSGYMLSMNTFSWCVQSCMNNGRQDTLVSIIERCKVHLFDWLFKYKYDHLMFITDCGFMDVIRKWIRTNLYALLGGHASILQTLQYS